MTQRSAAPASSTTARGRDAWLGSLPYWDVYFGLMLVAALLVVLNDLALPARAVAACLLVVLAGVYVGVGRSAVRRPEMPVPESWWYAAACMTLFVPANGELLPLRR